MTKKKSSRITTALRMASQSMADQVKATRVLVIAEVDDHLFCTGTPKSGDLVFTAAAKTAEIFLDKIEEQNNE
jgi:hypothetical protein